MATIDRIDQRHDTGKVYGYSRAALQPVQPKTVIVKLEGLDFNPTAPDLLEEASRFEPTDQAKIMRDLTRGKLQLLVVGLNPNVQEALTLANVGVGEANGHMGPLITTIKSLITLAQGRTYVEDSIGILGTVTEDPRINSLLIATEPPESNVFGKFIRIIASEDGTHIKMLINGQLAFAHPIGSKRLIPDLIIALEKAKSANIEPRQTRLPNNRDGITTITDEITYLKSQRRYEAAGYAPPQLAPDKAVPVVLQSACDLSVMGTPNERQKLMSEISSKIAPFIRREVAIPMSITFAMGLRAPGLKFKELDNLPTYGWLQFANFLATLDERVKMVYPPGLKVHIFDETPLFGPLLPGVTPESIQQGIEGSNRLLKAMGVLGNLIHIHPMLPEQFPRSEVSKTNPGSIDESRVYALVCSRPDMTNPKVMDPLYTDRQHRSYAELKRLAGEDIWEDSRRTAVIMGQCLQYRKNTKLFEGMIGTAIPIDATVTDKVGRIVLDVTPMALFNHGMPVVSRSDNGLYKIHIEPEYRLNRSDRFPNAKPVRLAKSELGAGPGYMTFYYDNSGR